MKSERWRTMTTIPLAFACLLLFFASNLGVACAQRLPDRLDIDARIYEFIQRIRSVVIPSPNADAKALGGLVALLAQGDSLVKSQQDINFFRGNDDQDVINRLTQMALIKDRDLRIRAARILINVVDNSTLCVVLDRLADRQVFETNEDGFYNLLQVVRVMVTTNEDNVFEENYKWVKRLVSDTSELADRPGKEKTRKLLSDIERAADTNRSSRKMSAADAFPSEYNSCLKLPNIPQLDRPRS